MEINLALQLPRDALSIPLVRHLCRQSLQEVGVEPDCSSDIEVALSEACTNALRHSGPGEEYKVNLSLDERHCVISVEDTGLGFDGQAARSDPSAEQGRGIELMHSLVDKVDFVSSPQAGTVVHLEKELVFTDGSLTKRPRGGPADGG